MNADRLLALYERIADAPDAVGRLRRFVLDLAVRGKLVLQDPADEPASELLKRVHRHRKLKKKLAQIGTSELENPLPQIPPTWTWTTVDQVSADDENAITDGPFGSQLKTVHYVEDAGFRVIRLQNVGNGIFRDEHRSYIDRIRFSNLAKHHVRAGDLVVAGLVDPNLRSCEIPDNIGPALVKADCYRLSIHNKISSKFILYFMNSPLCQEFATVHHHGMTLIRIGLGNFRRIPVPLPPLAEQRRIVAKVDELMALCDRLETARLEREATRDRLAAASLARLNAPDPETFTDDARFALNALPALTTRPDQIKQLRQTILNLAVRGKLVPQDPADKPLAVIDRALRVGTEFPFEIPPRWQWARLHTLGKLKGGGTPSKGRDDFWNGSIPWVSPKDMKVDYIAAAQLGITETAISGSATSLIETGSVLFVVRGMILAHSFPVAVTRVPLTVNQDMKALVLKEPETAEYLLRALKGLKPEMLSRVQRSSHGTCRLEGADYRDFLVPIPPLAEQHRIVAKVDDLIALCDQLESSLTTCDATRRRLLDTTVSEVLRPGHAHSKEALR